MGGGNWVTHDRDGEETTAIGQKRNNPYAVENIQQAYNNLYGPDISSLDANYLYVRFLPQSPEDVKILLESGLELWDFPLDYDIISIGEYYHDPSVTDSTYTWQYTVVPAGYTFPGIQYEILEQLALVPEDSRIAEEAFRLTGNEFEVPDEYEPDPPLVNGKFEFVLDHSSPDGTGAGTGGACNCPLPDHTRKPSGCVQVFDNMLNQWHAVREVKIIVSKSRLFGIIFHRTDYTDASGCWQINQKYHGKIHVWVKWESATCNIKTMKSWADLWNYTFPRRAYIGKYNGPFFNNIAIQFNWTNSIGNKTFRNWVASTVNNTIYAFQFYASDNDLPNPPGDLKVLITPWGSGNTGATPMLDKSFLASFILTSDASGLFGGLFAVTGPIGSLAGISIGAWLALAAPDIVLNVNDASEVNSDDIRELMYHELAHAQHFTQVSNSYWLDNIEYIIHHLDYGDGTAPGAGRCAVIEMWGWQNGMWATHLSYGLNHSNPPNLGGGALAANTWQGRLEFSRFASGYIPFGWQYDIIDDDGLNPSLGISENNSVSDAVKSYTRAQIFTTMTSSMLSPTQQKNALLPLLPPIIPLAAWTILASAYGI